MDIRSPARTLALGFVLIAIPGISYAYLDPGTGSILLQVILGGMAAIGVAFKLYWHRIRTAFRRTQSSEPE